jgi:uncharacterized phage-associated protein
MEHTVTHTSSSAPTAIDLASYLLHKTNRAAGESINLMKLNALLYFCEAWSLGAYDRELITEEIQAWDHGPVVYSVWEKLTNKGWNDLDADALQPELTIQLNDETISLIDDVMRAYAGLSTVELETRIKRDAPWKEARRGLPAWDLTKRPMSKKTMTDFYRAAFDTEPSTHAA